MIKDGSRSPKAVALIFLKLLTGLKRCGMNITLLFTASAMIRGVPHTLLKK